LRHHGGGVARPQRLRRRYPKIHLAHAARP
jgi:hypothetical protein